MIVAPHGTSEKRLVPAPVLRNEGLRSCSTIPKLALSAPNIIVTARASGSAIVLHLSSVSAVGFSADPTDRKARFRAFVDINGRSMLIRLPAGRDADVAMERVGDGRQTIRYGVFAGTHLVNGGILCIA
jgi:hypothetical protein